MIFVSDDNAAIWAEYKKTKSKEVKEKLILEYASLVKYVAGRVSMHVGSYVEFDDLVSYGIFGLIDAIEKFDTDKGVKFVTYASLRIRGEIIDNIRKLDWVPRTLRQKNKVLEQALNDFETKHGRTPTELELSKILNIDIEEVNELLRKANISSLISLDDYLEQNHEKMNSGLVSSGITGPEKQLEIKEVKKMLIDGINSLNDNQKKVITLYYFEELTLKEISKIMGVSESRISQIHSNSVRILKTKLGKYKSILYFY